jgi:hypothetical protein
MPSGDQWIHIYGTKGAADLMGASMVYPPSRDVQPTPLAARQQEDQHAHTRAFYESVLKGAKPPADIVIGATAALTAIMGNLAMVRRTVIEWKDLGVNLD